MHVRRSDKFTEANFFEPSDYMVHVEEFYEAYFLKHPEKANTTKRMVYIASDDQDVFGKFKNEYVFYSISY